MIRISQWTEGHCKKDSSIRRMKSIQKPYEEGRLRSPDLSVPRKKVRKTLWGMLKFPKTKTLKYAEFSRDKPHVKGSPFFI